MEKNGTESVEEESYEILDLIDSNKSKLEKTMDQIFGDITKASAAKQLAVGGGTGWVTGFLFVKVGKAAAITLCATGLAFQVAQYNGLITVNWTKLNRLAKDAQHTAKKQIQSNSSSLLHTVKDFYDEHKFLSVGFSAGFFAGVFF